MTTNIQFTKMHGLGNDFVIINALNKPLDSKKIPIMQLANRFTGIGFDQLLVLEEIDSADFFCRIFNADGSEAEQCGNGLRCVARYLHEEKIHAKNTMTIATIAGIFPVSIKDYDHISVTMGTPIVQENLTELQLKHNPNSVLMSVLSVGNPHAIIKVEQVETALSNQLGHEISTHTYFPNGANVGFMQVVAPDHIRLRTYERGAGETLACGSNACAAAVAGIVNGWLQSQVSVEFRHGKLQIEWQGDTHPIIMTGPAARVFTGEFSY